jgi:REP element-mobilizing transposase RayT
VTLFKNKYRVESTRLHGWDYSSPGLYLVTIWTKSRECFFGYVTDGGKHLSPIGDIVAEEWQRTPLIRTNVDLDEWVVMPNHLHGIIVINNDTQFGDVVVETPRSVSTQPPQLKPNSLGSIINQFKSVCTKRIWAQAYSDFRWQERYYDHIVRNEKDLQRIRNYIAANPNKWNKDRNNRVDLWM